MWLMHMLQAVPRAEWAIDVCCKGSECGVMLPEARLMGADVIRCPLPFYVGKFVSRLTRILQAGKYDILHAHLGAHSAFAVRAARRAGIPVISTFHNTSYPPQTTLTMLPVLRHARTVYAARSIRYTLTNSDLVTAVSTGVAQSLAGIAPESAKRIRVSYLGVPETQPLSVDDKRLLRASLQLQPKNRVLLHVGRFLSAKNHQGLIEIFDLVRRRVGEIVLLMAGDGPLRTRIQAMATERGIDGAVRFLGIRNDVSALMQLSDVLVMPSRHEGLPLAVMEAGATGLPIVGSNIPGIVEGVAPEQRRFLHDIADTSAMADSIVSLLESQANRTASSETARDHYRRNFSVDAAATRLVQLYEEIAS
jgi:glycosyltransferase involved in cell wall biosynthesis